MSNTAKAISLQHVYQATCIFRYLCTMQQMCNLKIMRLLADGSSPLRIIFRTQWFIIELKFDPSITVTYPMKTYTVHSKTTKPALERVTIDFIVTYVFCIFNNIVNSVNTQLYSSIDYNCCT